MHVLISLFEAGRDEEKSYLQKVHEWWILKEGKMDEFGCFHERQDAFRSKDVPWGPESHWEMNLMASSRIKSFDDAPTPEWSGFQACYAHLVTRVDLGSR